MKESQSQSVLMSKRSWAFLERSDVFFQTFQRFGEKQHGIPSCGLLCPEKRWAMTTSPPRCPKSVISLERCFVVAVSRCLICVSWVYHSHGMWHLHSLWCSRDVPPQHCRQDGFPPLPAIPLRMWAFSFNDLQNHLGTGHQSKLGCAA